MPDQVGGDERILLFEFYIFGTLKRFHQTKTLSVRASLLRATMGFSSNYDIGLKLKYFPT